MIALKFIADYDTRQIAQELGKSGGTVRALQVWALQALAKAMKKDQNGK